MILSIFLDEFRALISIFSNPGVTLATAGVQAAFLITARDQFYNERGIDEDSFYFNVINDDGLSATR
jgi:hypothetical protein